MMDVDKFNGQSFGEEIANSITHGIGLIASIVGLIFLILWISSKTLLKQNRCTAANDDRLESI